MANEILSRRKAIAAAGTVLIGGATTASGQQGKGKSTIVASSPDCETILVEYTDAHGPDVFVRVSGPESQSTTLAPGENVTWTVESGSYDVKARPAPGAPTNSNAGEAIAVEGSPVDVEECAPPGLPVTFEGRSEDRGVLTITNGFEDRCVTIFGERIAPDGSSLGSFRVEMSPGETRNFSISFHYESTSPIHYEIEALAGEPGPDGRCRFPTDPVPILGEDPLILSKEDCAGFGSS